MADLLKEIEAQIAGAKVATAKQNVGVIREVGDGVARVEGLTDAMLNEMLDLGHGVTGLALDLDETEVGVIILGDFTKLEEGDEVRTTGKLLQVPVGKGLLGRVVDTLGQPLDGKGPVTSEVTYPVENLAPGIIRRKPVNQPVQTGIMAIDSMIPVGRGQRELIIATARRVRQPFASTRSSIRRASIGPQKPQATRIIDPSTAFTSRSDKSSQISRESSAFLIRPEPSPTPSSSPRPPQIQLLINIWPHLQGQRWGSGLWITAWMR